MDGVLNSPSLKLVWDKTSLDIPQDGPGRLAGKCDSLSFNTSNLSESTSQERILKSSQLPAKAMRLARAILNEHQ